MTSVEEFRHDANQYAIASFFGDVEMKCSIRRKVEVLRMQVGIHRFKDPSQLSDVRIADLLRSHSRRLTFNGDASAHDLQRTFAGSVGRKRPLGARTKTPAPGRTSTTPSTSSAIRASRTEGRETFSCSANSRSEGSRARYRERAFFDVRPNLKRYLLVEAAGLNDSKSHRLCTGIMHWQHDNFSMSNNQVFVSLDIV